MSVLSEKVRTALYSAMNVSAVTTLATGGIHHLVAPEGTAMPFVVFGRQAPSPVTYTFKQTRLAEQDLWLIRATSDENASATKEPQQLNEDILGAVETAVGQQLTLAGGSQTWSVKRFADIPEYMETANDRIIYHNGFLLEIWAV
jgi:hypothetical protein